MITTIPQKYYNNGYNLLYERECLYLLEKQGIGFYPFVSEIELILQVIKKNYENNLDISKFNINDIPGCNIPFADNLIIIIDNNFTGSYGEYDPVNQYTQYDNVNNKFKTAVIILYIVPDDNGNFDESKYRQVIAHELVHLRDDYEIRKATNNAKTLITNFVNGNLDNGRIQADALYNPIANIIYRLFIDSEIHALGSQMYIDMYNLFKNSNNITRHNAYKDMINTDTMKEYNIVKTQYIDHIKYNNMFANFAIKYFPKWFNKFNNSTNINDRNKIKEQFKKWFIKIAETHLKDVFNRIVKSASLFYDDFEVKEISKIDKLEDLIKQKKLQMKKVNECLGLYSNIPADEFIQIYLINRYGNKLNIKVKYNSCIEQI